MKALTFPEIKQRVCYWMEPMFFESDLSALESTTNLNEMYVWLTDRDFVDPSNYVNQLCDEYDERFNLNFL